MRNLTLVHRALALFATSALLACGSSDTDSGTPTTSPTAGGGGSGGAAGTGGTANAGHAGAGGDKGGSGGAAAAGKGGSAGTSNAGSGGVPGAGGAGAGGMAGTTSVGGMSGGAAGTGGDGGMSAAGMGGGGGACGGDHSPCVTGHALPPDCPCAKAVCQGIGDNYCCTNGWDLSCVERAYLNCVECTGGPIEHQSPSILPASDVTITSIVAGGDGNANAMSCAIDADAQLWCWGANLNGQLNDGTFGKQLGSYFPRLVPGVKDITEAAANGVATCAIDKTGVLWCWGDLGIAANQCADNVFTPPTQMLTDVAHVALSGHGCDQSFCALKTDGTVWCWGSLYMGFPILGDGKTGWVDKPTQVAVPPATAIASNDNNVCAILKDTTVRCWGEITQETGNYTAATNFNCWPSVWNNTPDQDCKDPISGVTDLALGRSATCVIVAGAVRCIGSGSVLGTKTGAPGPVTPVLSAPAVSVHMGNEAYVACALLTSGAVECWGNSAFGSTGTADPTVNEGSILPEPVLGLSGATSLSYAATVGIAQTMDGSVYTWGNSATSLGIGTTPGNEGVGFPVTRMTFKSTPP